MDREKTILENQGLVHMVARRYKGKGVEYEDMVQEGFIGLMEAVDRYDPTRSKFSTYATIRIRKRILSLFEQKENTLPLEAISEQEEESTDNFLWDALTKLKERERYVVESYHGLIEPQLNYTQLSKVLKVSERRVRAIYEAAIKKLRNYYGGQD